MTRYSPRGNPTSRLTPERLAQLEAAEAQHRETLMRETDAQVADAIAEAAAVLHARREPLPRLLDQGWVGDRLPHAIFAEKADDLWGIIIRACIATIKAGNQPERLVFGGQDLIARLVTRALTEANPHPDDRFYDGGHLLWHADLTLARAGFAVLLGVSA